MKTQKGFSLVEILIAAGVVILVGVGAFLFFTQEKVEEENTEVVNESNVLGPLDDITFEEDQAMEEVVDDMEQKVDEENELQNENTNQTTSYLQGLIEIDSNGLHCDEALIEDFDIENFRLIGEYFFTDNKKLFSVENCEEYKYSLFNQDDELVSTVINLPALEVIEGTEGDGDYYKDDKFVYYKLVYYSDFAPGFLIMDADVSSTRVGGECFFGYGGVGYFLIDNFKVYGYGKVILDDSSNYKYFGRAASNMSTIEGYFTDGESVYFGCYGEILPDLNPDTTEIVNSIYVKDDKSVYGFGGELMEGISPEECTEKTLRNCHPDGLIPF